MIQNGTLTREETARYLNVSLPVVDAYMHRRDNPLPNIRVGRKYIIPSALLDEWLRAEAERQQREA